MEDATCDNVTSGHTTTPPCAHSSFDASVTAIALFCFQLFLSVMTVTMNMLILSAFHVEKKLRTYANQYILNITISDILVGIIMSIRCSIVLFDKWIFGDVLSILFIGVQNIALGVSVLGVIAICLDRYVATYYPILHFKRKRKKIAHIVNGITWLASISFWLPVAVIWDFVQPSGLTPVKDYFAPNYSRFIYSTIPVAFLRLAVPFIIIASLYFKIYGRVKRSGSKYLSERFDLRPRNETEGNDIATIPCQQIAKSCLVDCQHFTLENNTEYLTAIHMKDINEAVLQEVSFKGSLDNTMKQQNSGTVTKPVLPQKIPVRVFSRSPSPKNFSSSRQDLSSHDNHKIMRTLTFITTAFFITWLPNSINVIYANVVSTHIAFAEVARWVTYLNSLINPIAYAMAQPLFRRTILRILRCQR